RAAAPAENERPFGELARKREALLAEGVLRDHGRFGEGKRQEGRLGHRVASCAPRPRDADEPGSELAAADVALIARAERHGRVRVAVGAFRPEGAHHVAGTSSSSVSGRGWRFVSARVGCGPGFSWRRLIQIVRRPSSLAGAMSWCRLAGAWTGVPRGGGGRSKKVFQWGGCRVWGARCVAAAEGRGREATIASSKGTPRLRVEASMKSRSVFERIASFQPRARASTRAADTSGNGSQAGRERASAAYSVVGALSSRIASVSTSR